MTIWFKKRLVCWIGCAAVVGVIGTTATTLKAQSQSAETPREAGQKFGTLLTLSESDDWRSQYSQLRWGLISRRDYSALGSASIDTLLNELRGKMEQIRFNASDPREENGETVLEISPDPKPLNLPVVVIREGDKYVIDLVATFRRAEKLEDGAFQKRIFALTKVVLPGLPNADSISVRDGVCRKNLKELHLALMMYSQDYDEFLPPAEKWSDVLEPYVPNKAIFNCPSAPGGKWGYAFNKNLSGQNIANIEKPSLTYAFYETTDLRPNVNGTGEEFAYRHKTKEAGPFLANGVTFDGRVKYIETNKGLEFGLKPKVPKMRH
ncbi:hypothetical protein EON80_21850 [bacterium]|nr:MAG: hypothetical protein EON80_21850 [bacterium]